MSSTGHPWYTGEVKQRQIHTTTGLVEYADLGEGIPILYFHGNGAGNDAAIMLEKKLIDDGFRLIVPNRPGYYGTPLQFGRMHDHCADLAHGVLDQLHVERVVVIGTSGGGPAACRFAARFPQNTSALILQCALSHPFDAGQWMPRGLSLLLPVFRHLSFFLPILRFGNRRQAKKKDFIADCMTPERFKLLRSSPALDSLGPLMSASMVRCAEWPDGTENDWANWTTDPWLTPGEISCPTLILHDRADTVVPIAHAEWALHCIPDARFCELNAGGHMIWIGQDVDKMFAERTEFIRQNFDKA